MRRLVPDRLRFGAQALALRLRLGRMLRRSSLPGLLGAITPRRAALEPVPLPEVERGLLVAEGLLERLRVVPDTCLYRSLARYAVLRAAGHPARFVMGLSPRSPEIAGHAWVELGGEPLGETVDGDMVVTYAYPR
jgi:Transglutaminase-like superfamily